MTAPKILSLGNGSRARRLSSRPARLRILLALPAAAAAAAALAACSSSGAATTPSSSASSSPAASSAGSSPAGTSSAASGSAAAAAVGLKTASIGGVTVLTNTKGFALYTFAPDTATTSACNGACAAAWPPQTAPATVKSPYSTIKRSDGSAQLAFNGHPLYTYIADTAPGTATGNGVTAFGGLWSEVPASGAAAPAGSS
jgi:predicted lipoprotein with Yx(FWY)xxD motif